MIVPSMTSKELIREILSDDENIKKKVFFLSLRMRREAIKSKTKHVRRSFDYTTKKYNKWIIVIDYHKKKQEFYSVIHYHDDYGFNAVQVNSEGGFTHFSAHFLDRYNERYLKLRKAEKTDLLKRFIVENPISAVKYTPQHSSQRNTIFCRFKEGIALGDEEILVTGHRIIHFKTYLSNGMIHKDQVDDFEFLGEVYQKELREIENNYPRRA